MGVLLGVHMGVWRFLMIKYNRATVVPKSGVHNLQAVVTVPVELRK